MPTLHLLRHAKSSWDDADRADRERPLAPRGQRAARHLAAHLSTRGFTPALVLCSSALRTRQTLDLLAPALAPDTDILVEEGLYLADADDLLDRLRRIPPAVPSLLLIGHNPSVQELALTLAAGPRATVDRLRAKFPTGALATLALRGTSWRHLAPGGGELVRFLIPSELDTKAALSR